MFVAGVRTKVTNNITKNNNKNNYPAKSKTAHNLNFGTGFIYKNGLEIVQDARKQLDLLWIIKDHIASGKLERVDDISYIGPNHIMASIGPEQRYAEGDYIILEPGEKGTWLKYHSQDMNKKFDLLRDKAMIENRDKVLEDYGLRLVDQFDHAVSELRRVARYKR